MKIAYICADLGIPVFGNKGASVHIREMVNALQKQGNEVVIFSPYLMNDSRSDDDIKTVEISADAENDYILKEMNKLCEFIGVKSTLGYDLHLLNYNSTFYNHLIRFLTNERFDLIYERYSLFNYSGIALARDFNIPHLLEINSPLLYEHRKMVGLELFKLAKKIEIKIFRESDCLLAVSGVIRNYCVKAGISDNKIIQLPNGVDSKKFKSSNKIRADLRSKLNINEKIVIGFIGSFRPWHDLKMLLNSFYIINSRYKKTHLLIVGDGPSKDKFTNYANKLGLSDTITWTGYVPHDVIPEYISAMDITTAPYKSNKYFYFSPLKVVEYMAAGRPVIATDIGQLKEIINNHHNGFLYQADNINEFTNIIVNLIHNKDLIEQVGLNARNWVRKNRNWYNNAKSVLHIAKSLIDKRLTVRKI